MSDLIPQTPRIKSYFKAAEGECLGACVAGLLGIHIPKFTQRDWVAELISLCKTHKKNVIFLQSQEVIEEPYIRIEMVSGSPHALIWQDGYGLIHNPSDQRGDLSYKIKLEGL